MKICASVAEAAELLGIGQSKLRSLVRENKIPFFRCGRRVLFNIDELKIWTVQKTFNKLTGGNKNGI